MKMADTKKTSPWQGLAEAGIGSIGSLVSAFSQIGAAKRQHKYNMAEMEQEQKYALEQMEQSQQYNLANMSQQNQYQIDAEKRAQEWNDVGAQITRGQQAGVSALATLGAGSSQSMGVSSAPSSSTPSPAGAPSSKGVSKPGLNFDTSALGKLVQQGRMVDSQIEGIDAEVKLKDAERENVEADTRLKQQQYDSIEWYNLNRRSLEKELLESGVSKAKSDAIIADLNAKYEKWKNTEKTDEGYTLAQQEFITVINEAMSLIDKNKAEAGLADEQAADLKGTRDSRNRANIAGARSDEATAKFKELNNEMFEKYGVSYNSSLSGAIVQGTGKLLEDVSKFLNPGMQNPKGYVELIKSITDHDIKDFNELLRYLSPAQRTMQDNFLDACKRFKTVISGKDPLVRNAVDISNPMSGIW